MFNKGSNAGISLNAAGLVALADLKTLAIRTSLVGGASFADILVLAPGIHCQQAASDVNGGEYPATGAMTSGYVFRIENQATVAYLQRAGEPGCLTNVVVSPPSESKYGLFFAVLWAEPVASSLYLTAIALTTTVVGLLGAIRDWSALGVLSMLMLARLLNTIVIKRRSVMGWKGKSEPGVKGDLLILLTQDRWIRMRGSVDDLKAVASGQWLREVSDIESVSVGIATLLVYGSAALTCNVSTIGSLILAVLLLVSIGLLGVANMATRRMRMFDRVVSIVGKPQHYERRLVMVKELIEESGRDDWAIGMGLIVPTAERAEKVTL